MADEFGAALAGIVGARNVKHGEDVAERYRVPELAPVMTAIRPSSSPIPWLLYGHTERQAGPPNLKFRFGKGAALGQQFVRFGRREHVGEHDRLFEPGEVDADADADAKVRADVQTLHTPRLMVLDEFVGPVDLALSMGFSASEALAIPAPVGEAIGRVMAACTESGLIAGCPAFNRENARDLLNRGVRLLSVGADIGLLRRAAAAEAAEVRGWIGDLS